MYIFNQLYLAVATFYAYLLGPVCSKFSYWLQKWSIRDFHRITISFPPPPGDFAAH